MLVFLILAVVFLSMGIMFLLMIRVFKTLPVDYTASPQDLDLPYETVRFPTKNECQLHGWWIPYKEGMKKPVLILLHGWRRNAERMMPYILALQDYNLFVFDSRNHGKSESDTFSSMPRFAEDLIAALDHLDHGLAGRHSGKYVVIGLSMGGAAAIYAASRDDRISTVVTVGAFANAADVMRREYRKRHISYFPLVLLVFEYFQYHIGMRFKEFAPENNIRKSSARFLLVHGKLDDTAPFSHAERLLSAARNDQAELLTIADAGHSDCHESDLFWPAVTALLDRVLGE